MKTTINNVLFIKDTISTAITEKKILPKLKMQLLMAIDPIEEIIKKAETIRVDLIKELGVAGEDGSYSVGEDNIKEFTDKLGELYSVEVDIPNIDCVPESLENSEELSALEMRQLIKFAKGIDKPVEDEVSEVVEA